MKKIFLLLTVFLLLTSFTEAVTYQPLAPIDGYIQSDVKIDNNSLSTYLNDMFRLGIALCTGLAVLMIIIGGIQYASSDAWSKKTDGKERIYAALFGLVIALGSWVLLNTINPALVSTELSLEKVEILSIEQKFAELNTEQQQYVQTGRNTGTTNTQVDQQGQPGVTPTGTHVSISDEIPNQASGKKIDSSMAQGLQNMNTELKAAGINWTITEAYPPSREHKAACHKTGTCIDADFVGNANPSPEQVKKFIDTASNNGFRAVWEVKTESERNRMISGGVPESRVIALGNWISGSHFSVYNK